MGIFRNVIAAIVIALSLQSLAAAENASTNPAFTAKVYDQWPFDAAEAKRRQKETADALGVPVEKSFDLAPGVKLELVLVPAGEFQMGCGEMIEDIAKRAAMPNAKDSVTAEFPQHKVRITKPFYIGKFEVTQAQWLAVMGKPADPSEPPAANKPVVMVSYEDALSLLKKLTDATKSQEPFRLPTEAEWEFACRAGTTTAFSFGDSINVNQANYCSVFVYGGPQGDYREQTANVGTFPGNAFGLFDMHGNVWEWCADRFSDTYYKDSPKDDPAGPAAGAARALRSGCWMNPPIYARSSSRMSATPDARQPYIGFRVAMSIAATAPAAAATKPAAVELPPGVTLPAMDKFHLVLLMGQSNMATGVKLDAADLAVADRILVLDPKDGGRWLPVLDADKKPVVLNVGPGLGFAAEYARKNPGVTVGLVPTAVGGSPLMSWEKDAVLYKNALARLARVRDTGTLKAALWHQGETDAYVTTPNRETYGARLGKMIGDLRAELKEPQMPFIVGEIGGFVAAKKSFRFVGQINAALNAIPSQVKRTACVSAAGLTHGGDSLHFAEASSHDQGRRYEKAYEQIIAAPAQK